MNDEDKNKEMEVQRALGLKPTEEEINAIKYMVVEMFIDDYSEYQETIEERIMEDESKLEDLFEDEESDEKRKEKMQTLLEDYGPLINALYTKLDNFVNKQLFKGLK